MHAEDEDNDAEWMPRYLPARQCRDDPSDPARVFVPYCMRYETSGPNRTVFGQEDGEELVCICNVCNNALAGECFGEGCGWLWDGVGGGRMRCKFEVAGLYCPGVQTEMPVALAIPNSRSVTCLGLTSAVSPVLRCASRPTPARGGSPSLYGTPPSSMHVVSCRIPPSRPPLNLP